MTGRIVLAQRTPLTGDPPRRAHITLTDLRQMLGAYFTAPDTLYVGTHRRPVPVRYQVTGWDSHHKALTVERVDP